MPTIHRLLALLLLISTTVTTRAASDFVVVFQKVNPVMAPKTPGDELQECARDPVCRTLADSAAAQLGVPPGTVSGVMATVPHANRTGEEGHFTIALPVGYEYCRSKIRTVSVVPATGDRASVMSASSIKNGVVVYTWTPKRGLGQGRSWVEAEYTVYGVRGGLAEQHRNNGKCRPYGKQLIGCRGATGENKGQPACGTVED